MNLRTICGSFLGLIFKVIWILYASIAVQPGKQSPFQAVLLTEFNAGD
jgi:hypothetical protein